MPAASDPYWNFRKLMQIEERLGVRSSFYFLATDRDVRRFRYNIEDLSEVLGEMADNGWEVGLHGGYYAFDDPDEIKREKTRLENALGSPIIGYRNHYLQFKVPDTWRYLADAGFKYDTTIGYGDMIGFRNGMCHPYRPYDLHTGKEIDIMEIPLAIMDGALFDHAHTYDEALHSALRLVDTTAKYHGVITLLWHNSMFSAPFREHWAKLYVKLLEYCKAKNAWMTTGEEIWKWSKDH
jgi:peptidoglycan/xylan/chitin deacetylase (PgdA/CDA1 family)